MQKNDRKFNDQRRNQRGFSLLELLLVVGVGALLLLAGIATYRLVTQENAANEALEVIYTVTAGMHKLFAGQQGGYGNASLLPTLINANAFPASVHVTAGGVYHPMGQAMDVVGFDSYFEIQLYAISPGDCIKLGQGFQPGTEDNFLYLDVGGTVFDATTGLTVANLTPACSASDPIDVFFAFD